MRCAGVFLGATVVFVAIAIAAAAQTPTPTSTPFAFVTVTPSVCGSVCDQRSCGPVSCGVRRFFGTLLGLGRCDGTTSHGCECIDAECGSCGNGSLEAGEECDNGGTCDGGTGQPCHVDSMCPQGHCEPRGGSGCSANCTTETLVSATFPPIPYTVQVSSRLITISLAGAITFAEGKPGFPPPPLPCRPVAIRSFAPLPVTVPNIGCACVRGAVSPITYGPGNVGIGVIGCADAPNTLRADLTLQSWVLGSGCEPGHPEDGSDGEPCTDDDPARQSAPAIETQFACSGDCNGDGSVTVDEVLQGVQLAFGDVPLDQCPTLDRNGDQWVTVDEVLGAVGNALTGCTGLSIQSMDALR